MMRDLDCGDEEKEWTGWLGKKEEERAVDGIGRGGTRRDFLSHFFTIYCHCPARRPRQLPRSTKVLIILPTL